MTPFDFKTTGVGTTSVGLRWNESAKTVILASISRYRVQRSTDGTNWTTVNSSINALAYTVSGLTPCTTYYFRVSAHGDGRQAAARWSSPSSSLRVKTSCLPDPATPADFKTTSVGATSVSLRWNENARSDILTSISRYRVQRSTDGTNWTTESSNISTLTYTVSGLSSCTTYYFRVSAYGDGSNAAAEWSDPSNSISAKTTGCITDPVLPDPVTPADFKTTSVGTTSVSLRWNENARTAILTSISRYRVERSADGTNWTPVSDTINALTFTVSGLTPCTTRYFRVSAYGDGSRAAARWSSTSSSLRVKTLCPPDPVTPADFKTTSVGTTSVSLRWNENAKTVILTSISRYRVERSADGTNWTTASSTISALAYIVSGLTPCTTYYFRVSAYGDGVLAAARWSSTSAPLSVTTSCPPPPPTNSPPNFDEGMATTRSVPENTPSGTDIGSPISASDSDNDTLRYALGGTDAASFSISASNGQLRTSAALDFETKSSYSVRVSVSDGNGGSDSIGVTITVTNVNERPRVASWLGDLTMTAGDTTTISLSPNFSDPDGDALNYSTGSSNLGVATTNVSGSTLTLTAVSAGSATITVTAADRASRQAGRLSVRDDFTVTVEMRPAPKKVTGLTAMPGSVHGEIALDWDPADGAEYYEVAERRQQVPLLPIYHWVVLSSSEVTIDVGNTSAVVHGLIGGETYRHRVRGVRGTGSDRVEGPWSDYEETTLTLPNKVRGLSGAPGQNHAEIDLDWDAADGATGYQVRQRKPRPFPLPDTWIELPGEGFGVAISTTTTAVVSNLDPDKEYVYQVRGTNVHGEGEWSDSSAEIAVRDERPATPQGLVRGLMRGYKGIFLRWQAAAGAQDYEVETSPQDSSNTTISGESATVTRLTPGTRYSFRVRAWKVHGASRLYSPWSDTVRLDAKTPLNIGHQEDHTVAYMVGRILSAPNLPSGFPDPAKVIRDAIPDAVADWNNAASAIAGKNLNICEAGSCGSSNHDSGTTTVKTVDLNNDSAGRPSKNHNEGCGSSVACVKSSTFGQGKHLGDMSLIIEEPAWECWDPNATSGSCRAAQSVRIYWTDIQGDDLKDAIDMTTGSVVGIYHYIDPLMIHEFGHTLGMPDFYNDDETGLKGLPAVMDNHHFNMMITVEDIAQLEAIYAIHDSASH